MKNTYDFENQLKNAKRSTTKIQRDGNAANMITLERFYNTSVDDLWNALTDKTRISRWFTQVSGDLKQGGNYMLKDNAEGTITSCDAPNSFVVTWEYGGDISWVEVFLEQEINDRTHLILNHISFPSEHWETYGPGATGVGWDLAFLGLQCHLKLPSEELVESFDWSSGEVKEFIKTSCECWGQAAIDTGELENVALAAVEQTISFYTGE